MRLSVCVCVCARESAIECVCVRERERERGVTQMKSDAARSFCDGPVCVAGLLWFV